MASVSNVSVKKTASQAIVELLATENRRVLSDWRATLLLRRATASIPAAERRWVNPPTDVSDIYPILRQMQARGEIKPIPKLPNLYEVTVPYARSGLLEEDEVLMEAHPYAALSHLSALVFHSMTDELPIGITAIVPATINSGMFPVGTEGSDWESLVLVRGRSPQHILNSPVKWIHIKPERYFGTKEYQPRGYPVRVTTPERTLLDGLLDPALCGGFENVLQAWIMAKDILDVDALVEYVQRLKVSVLRQRVGFILEEIALSHPAIETWQQEAKRGGSSKLLGSEQYSGTFSERWNLSINATKDKHGA